MEKASLYLGRPRSPGAPPAAGADTTGPGSPVGLRPPFGPGPVVPSHPDRRAALILSVASHPPPSRHWSALARLRYLRWVSAQRDKPDSRRAKASRTGRARAAEMRARAPGRGRPLANEALRCARTPHGLQARHGGPDDLAPPTRLPESASLDAVHGTCFLFVVVRARVAMRGTEEEVAGSLFGHVDLGERIPARHPLRAIRRGSGTGRGALRDPSAPSVGGDAGAAGGGASAQR